MHKIDGEGATAENEFTEGDPGPPVVLPTVATADWLNAMQAELVNAIQTAGVTLDKEDNEQLAKALRAGRQVILCTDDGDATRYELTPVDGIVPVALLEGLVVIFKATTTNASSPDIQLGESFQKSLTWPGGSIITAGKIKASQYCIAVYLSGRFELISRSAKKGMEHVADSFGYPRLCGPTFDVDGNISNNTTFESIGPTGSGANHIWTALDSVPVGAEWVKIEVNVNCYTTGGASELTMLQCIVYARKGGTSAASGSCRIGRGGAFGNSSGYAGTCYSIERTVPISTNRIFDFTWLSDFATNSVVLTLVACGVNQ